MVRWSVLLLSAALVAWGIAGGGSGALANERPLASLVPPDASTYSELNLDRLLGRAPETAALRAALLQMSSLGLARQLLAEIVAGDPNLAGAAKPMEIARAVADALGPRVGWATWIPDAQSLVSGMSVGALGSGGQPGPALGMMPRILLVADVSDPARLDAAIARICAELDLNPRLSEGPAGTTMAFAEGLVELVRGEGWMATGFPPEVARKASDRALGATQESLWTDPGYQDTMRRLPGDAVVTEYVSASTLRQLAAVANMMAPTVGVAYPVDGPMGGAFGLRVEGVEGRPMATAYYTADLDSMVSVLDAALAVQATLLQPVLARRRAEARAAACCDNLAVLAEAMQAYLEDHNGRFPDAGAWVEALQPYLDDPAALKCPEDTSDARCSYGMNRALSRRSRDDLADASAVVMFYETSSPAGGSGDVVSPPRHSDGGNYALADGSVMTYRPEDEEQPSFEVE